MFQVLSRSWALLIGMMLLMVGNGLQGTLLGVRGGIEGFSTFEMSIVMAAYFAGFLGGSRLAPEMIRRVGHVRVFAALASFISAILILYPAFAHPVAWAFGRVVIGFCFSGVYVTAESWLNNSSDNANRGKALSVYMIVQMFGIVSAQALLAMGDASGYALFILSSVLVSISFAPILLSISPTPAFDTAKPMPLRTLLETSPLGCFGMFLLGGVFSAQFGMSAVYGVAAGLTIAQISIFVSSIYVGALLMQYPIGWFSDRMDRRLVIMLVAAAGGIFSLLAMFFDYYFAALLVAAFVIGGTSNPLYSLLIAYTNDYLDPDDMAAASGGLDLYQWHGRDHRAFGDGLDDGQLWCPGLLWHDCPFDARPRELRDLPDDPAVACGHRRWCICAGSALGQPGRGRGRFGILHRNSLGR